MSEDFIVSLPEEESPDFGVFAKRMPWGKRATMIRKLFPSTALLDWYEVFRVDPSIAGRVINDILKQEQAEPGRAGKRPSLNVKKAENSLRQIRGDDYTILPFNEALTILKGDRSIRHLARKCDISHPMMQRLLNGSAKPNPEIMEKAARAFGRQPAYFLEYRIAYIIAMLTYRMEAYPESSIVTYENIQGDSEKRFK